MPSTLLDARSITRHHGARTILQDVDVRVDASTRLALIGPNGSGKSTLLRAWPGSSRSTAGPSSASARSATCRSSPTTVARRPCARRSWSASASRRAARASTARRHGWPLATSTRSRPHAAALERWLALGGADAEARVAAGGRRARALGRAARPPAGDALRRPGGARRARGPARRALRRRRARRADQPPRRRRPGAADAAAGRLRRRLRAGLPRPRAAGALGRRRCWSSTAARGRPPTTRGGWAAYERERDAAHARAVAEHEQALARARAADRRGHRDARARPDGDRQGQAPRPRRRQARRGVGPLARAGDAAPCAARRDAAGAHRRARPAVGGPRR